MWAEFKLHFTHKGKKTWQTIDLFWYYNSVLLEDEWKCPVGHLKAAAGTWETRRLDDIVECYFNKELILTLNEIPLDLLGYPFDDSLVGQRGPAWAKPGGIISGNCEWECLFV